VGLAAAGRSDEQGVALRQQELALGAVEVDALDAADMAIGHQRDRAPGLALAAVAQLLEPLEDHLRRKDREILHKFYEVLEPRLSVLLERLHDKES
jgi:hypothetical protein